MKHRLIHQMMFSLLMVVLFIPSSFSENPPWTMTLTNDTWDGHTVYTVDVYIQSNDVNPIEVASISLGFRVPLASINGGTVTGSIVAGSSGLTTTSEIPTSVGGSTVGSNRIIKVAGKTPPGAGGGSLLSTVAPGTRILTLKLTNSVDWLITGTNTIDLALNAEYAWSLNAYVGGINTNINPTMNPLVKSLSGPLLPVELIIIHINSTGTFSSTKLVNKDREEQ